MNPRTVERLEKQLVASQPALRISFRNGEQKTMPLEEAISAIRSGAAYKLELPLTKDEQMAITSKIGRELEACMAGERYDSPDVVEHEPTNQVRIIHASKPFAVVRQDKPGYLVDDAGTAFFAQRVEEYAQARGLGFVIVKDYDPTREPWYKQFQERKGEN